METIDHLITIVHDKLVQQEKKLAINVANKVEDNVKFLHEVLNIANAIKNKTSVTQILSAPTTSRALYYGDRLSTISLVGGEASVDGNFVWKEPNTMPQTSKNQTAVFVPSDPVYQDSAEVQVMVEVVKVPTAIQVSPTVDYSTRGSKLSEIPILNGAVVDARDNYGIVAGTWSWEDGSIQVNSSGAFTAIFTPTNTDKYEPVSTQIIVMVM